MFVIIHYTHEVFQTMVVSCKTCQRGQVL